MLTTYINGRFLSQMKTGQQRFARELVAQLDAWLDRDDRACREHRLVILAPRHAAVPSELRHIAVRTVGSLQGHPWDQCDLPRYALGGILLSLCATGPLLHPRHVIAIHDAAPFANPDNFTSMYRLAHSLLMPLLARTSRRIITVSEFSKNELVRYCRVGAQKFHIVPNGADHILGTAADASVLDAYGLHGRRYVFALGTESRNKNFSAVAEAFNWLDRSDLTLAVAGGQNTRVFANYEIRDTANLVRLGYVSDAALRALYENALCFVLPSLYEGLGLPPLEAMLCGCPVVVSTAPALVESCGDGALYCDPHAPQELARHIARLADDADLRSRMRERGYARARPFTWAKSAERLINLLQILAGGRKV